MNIQFRKLNKSNIYDFKYLSKWDNDSEIKHFIRPNFKKAELSEVTPEQLFENEVKNNSDNNQIYIITAENIPIGSVSIQKDPQRLYRKVSNTGWISIEIGDKKYRGLGVGRMAMEFLEETCIKHGLNRIELGVFEFNTNARNFYKRLGYKEIATVENFTFYDGKWRNDIRMEKYLK